MPIKVRNIALTRSQTACLIALRHGKNSKSKVAIEAELDLIETVTALTTLGQLGLARQNRTSRAWRDCPREKLPLQDSSRSSAPQSSGTRCQRLAAPCITGATDAGQRDRRKLGITHQRVLQLVIRLHARGYVGIGDQENILWMVMRAGDKTRLLSRDQERVLSAIPRDYATDAKQIRLAARLPEDSVEKILERLITARLVETSSGPRGDQVYRLTSAGLSHPQRVRSVRKGSSYVCPLSQSVFVMCFPQLLMLAH